MRRIGLLLVASVGVVVAVTVSCREPRPPVTRSSADTVSASRSAGVVRLDSLKRMRERILRLIAESNTYLPAMLVQGDSILKRWPSRLNPPLSVFFPDRGPPGYVPAMRQAVRDAFSRWEGLGEVPIAFVYTSDSARADVHVRWITEFPMERSGQADVRWNGAGWLLSATLTLAVQNPGGRPLPPEAIRTVALHEIGHLIGLGHSDASADVMYPTTQVQEQLSTRDKATARILYALPPGSLRMP